MMIDGPGIAALFETVGADPSRETFAAVRSRWQRIVDGPLRGLCDAMGGYWRVYRPWRDMRFDPDGAAVKNFAGAVTEHVDGNGVFLRFDAHGLFVAQGMPMMARDQLAAFREALDDDDVGSRFVAAVADVRRSGGRVTAGRWDPLKTAPRGWPRDHPRIEWLRWKGVELPHRIGPVTGRIDEVADTVRSALQGDAPVTSWLSGHVGPSSQSPRERFGG